MHDHEFKNLWLRGFCPGLLKPNVLCQCVRSFLEVEGYPESVKIFEDLRYNSDLYIPAQEESYHHQVLKEFGENQFQIHVHN